MQQMRDVINAKEMVATNNQIPTQPNSQQQQMITSTTVAHSESPTPSNNVGGKATPSKKQLTEKVTVRTIPKKQVANYITQLTSNSGILLYCVYLQGPKYLVPPQISPPKKPNLNPAYFPVYEDDNECIICQEDMKDSYSVKLQCGHRFHKAVSHFAWENQKH